MVRRDRAAGWQHAKLSGHQNEALVKDLLDVNKNFQQHFLESINRPRASIIKTSIGGLHETNVPSVNGNKTKSKTDLKVYLHNNEIINISLKKSLGGQVYFVRAGLFINTFQKQFNTEIPASVQRAMNLFWAAADDALEIIEQYADKSNKRNYGLQVRHKSLNATTLKNYDEKLYLDLLTWFAENAYEIAKISFSMGAVLNKEEWSDFVWYINLLEENDVNDIFCIEDICDAAIKVAEEETYFSSINGGTTIQLPFGFVQWHQGQLQFHHNYEKIKTITEVLYGSL